MSGPIGTSQLMYSAAPGDFYGHQIVSSLRGSFAGDTYLHRAAGTPTSTKTMTMSYWVKKYRTTSTTGSQQVIFVAGTGGGTYMFWQFNPYVTVEFTGGNFVDSRLITNAAFHDTSAWYHHVLRIDSTQATATNRVRFYVNGVEGTYSSQTVQSDLAHNEDVSFINQDGVRQSFGGYGGLGHGTTGADVQMAEIVFCDGQSLGPDSFGETKSGVWIPKDPSGLTFGDNGYYLKMLAGAIGTDSSGNDNDFTVANFAAHDVLLDSPTFNDTNGGNFATMNPNTAGTGHPVLAEGNLMMDAFSGSDIAGALATYGLPPQSGKWYFECFINAPNSGDNYPFIGLTADAFGLNATKGVNQRDLSYNLGTGGSEKNATYTGTITTTFTGHNAYADNTVAGLFVDMDARKLWFAKDGSFFNSANPQTGANASYSWTNDITLIPHFISFSGYGADSVFNFGQEGTFAGNKTAGDNADVNGYGNFLYDPGDYKSLCAANFPTPSTDPADNNEPQKNFGCLLYTGTGQSSQAQTGLGFLPDMVLIKERGGTAGWKLFDSSRGVTNYLAIHNTDAEADENDSLTAFGSDGFTVGSNAGTGANTTAYASWNWKCNGGTTSTNSDGALNCTQQVNADAGFSISTYTGNGQNSTIGHGLSSIPDITMFRERGTAGNWIFRIKGDGNDNNLYPHLDNATSDGNYFQDTAATATVTSIGTHADINGSSATYVMWAWESKVGFSKHGLLEGNNNANGAFMFLGFRPAFVMLKSLDSTSGWYVYDNKREGYNPDNDSLEWDVTTAEQTDDQIDLLSNGFKLRASGDPNVAETFIYMAFAEVPFQYATAR